MPARLRLLGQSLDVWSKLHRLAGDTQESSELRTELDALREMIAAQRGIRAVKRCRFAS